jgi:hypothetical protein
MAEEGQLEVLRRRIEAEEARSAYFARILWVIFDSGILPEEARGPVEDALFSIDPSEGSRLKGAS